MSEQIVLENIRVYLEEKANRLVEQGYKTGTLWELKKRIFTPNPKLYQGDGFQRAYILSENNFFDKTIENKLTSKGWERKRGKDLSYLANKKS